MPTPWPQPRPSMTKSALAGAARTSRTSAVAMASRIGVWNSAGRPGLRSRRHERERGLQARVAADGRDPAARLHRVLGLADQLAEGVDVLDDHDEAPQPRLVLFALDELEDQLAEAEE